MGVLRRQQASGGASYLQRRPMTPKCALDLTASTINPRHQRTGGARVPGFVGVASQLAGNTNRDKAADRAAI